MNKVPHPQRGNPPAELVQCRVATLDELFAAHKVGDGTVYLLLFVITSKSSRSALPTVCSAEQQPPEMLGGQ